MKTVTCSRCGQEFAMNDTLRVAQQTMCRPCGDDFVKANNTLSREQIERNVDPTVCAHCGFDNGSEELKRLAHIPVCEKCEAYFRDRPYPGWVKAAMATVALLVVLSVQWNWRFVEGYKDLRRAREAVFNGDMSRAVEWIESAEDKVPESHKLVQEASLMRGIYYLRQDRNEEAVREFLGVPEKWGARGMLLQAQIGIAFDKGDYDELLRLAYARSEYYNDDPVFAGQIASAYACKYAVSGDEEYKQKCLEYLEKYKSARYKPGDYMVYVNRIEHRLFTREIIAEQEFFERYPNGWVKPEDAGEQPDANGIDLEDVR